MPTHLHFKELFLETPDRTPALNNLTNEILQPWTSEKKGGGAIVKASYNMIKVKYLQLLHSLQVFAL